MQNVDGNSAYHLLRTARAEALKSRQYKSEETRMTIINRFTEVFDGKRPYGWQVDTCEALLLGLDCIVIAGTGTQLMAQRNVESMILLARIQSKTLITLSTSIPFTS